MNLKWLVAQCYQLAERTYLLFRQQYTFQSVWRDGDMIFLSAGHHLDKQGAEFNGITEFSLSQQWVAEIAYILGHNARVVPCGVLAEKTRYINSLCARDDIAVEIHFNSDPSHSGAGCECLYFPGSDNGEKVAKKIQSQLAILFSPDRGIKPGYYRLDKSRGINFFLERTKCTAIIIEPDFIHRLPLIQHQKSAACLAIANALNVY